MTKEQGHDYALWESLIVSADQESIAPSWRFGKYVNPVAPRSALRQTPEGRALLLSAEPPPRGRHHERGSDISPFVAWDGEGITYEQGMPQQYVLFGCSLGHTVSSESLSTVDCLETIIAAEQALPHAIHVGFSFKYDAEMILRDLTLPHWYVMREENTVRFGPYRITYHPGRLFRVSKRMKGGRLVTATIYDVWGFFQSSFVKALRTWLDESELGEIDAIEAGKAARGEFTYDQLETFIAPYWRSELRLLVVLCDRLRERMVAADVCPQQWYGAGALATVVYRRQNTRQHQARTEQDWNIKDRDITTILPKEVNDAARHAYAGGRFEHFRLGHTDETVYQYDINSAYPNAIAKLPSLRDSEWQHSISPKFDHHLFALWRIEYADWSVTSVFKPQPLFHRSRDGRVSYPPNVGGWYWTPEAAIVARNPDAHIVEAWICHHNGEYPFTWVAEMYAERKRRKANNDPSEKALKLALNSLYGKMAQRLGYQPEGPLPRFHQLEWAGWVTSFTRMQLYAAMQQAGSSLVAVETDAVFSTKRLELDVGPGLGQWEMTEHDWITYLQSGTYWSNHGAKYRGFDRDSLTHEDAMQWLRNGDWSASLIGTTSRFIGAGTGLGTPLHRCWVTDSRDMQPGKAGKRLHAAEACRACGNGLSPAEYLHPLICISPGGFSYPHPLPWRDEFNVATEWQDAYAIQQWDAEE